MSVQPAEAPICPVEWTAQGTGWLATWHLLSFDAPTVAAVWTWFVARVAHVAVPPVVPAAMFVAVWLVYAGDRLLDSRTDQTQLEDRHRFHYRHWRRFAAGMGVASIALVPLVHAIPWTILKLYLGLSALLLAWIALVHRNLPSNTSRLPKELMPGVFCAAAAFIPVWASVGVRSNGLLLAAIFYALLCTLNCWAIFAWEHPDTLHAHPTTRFGVRWLREVGIVATALPLLTLYFCEAHLAPIFIAIALAAGLLIALDHVHDSLQRTDLRAAADLVLVTPLLIAVVLR